jgi:hypothetical protein
VEREVILISMVMGALALFGLGVAALELMQIPMYDVISIKILANNLDKDNVGTL